jgi:hypothetical protein
MSKENRVDTANKFIKIISDHGRRFFEHKGEVGRFELKNGHIVWVCEYTKNISIYHISTGNSIMEAQCDIL